MSVNLVGENQASDRKAEEANQAQETYLEWLLTDPVVLGHPIFKCGLVVPVDLILFCDILVARNFLRAIMNFIALIIKAYQLRIVCVEWYRVEELASCPEQNNQAQSCYFLKSAPRTSEKCNCIVKRLKSIHILFKFEFLLV